MAHLYECDTLDGLSIVINLDIVERIIPQSNGSLILFQGGENGVSVRDTPAEIARHWVETRFDN